MTHRNLPLLADHFTVGERPTLRVSPPPDRPRRRLPIANPMAQAVLSRVTTRFRAATEHALAAESEQGRAAEFIAALTDFLERGGPAPAALRSALSSPAVLEVSR